MSTLYRQGSSSTNVPSGSNSLASASTSNPQGHSHIPATAAGVITPGPYNFSPSQFPSDSHFPAGFPPNQPSPYFPPLPYGYGFFGHSNNNSGPRFPANGFQFGSNSFSGSTYKGNNSF